MKDVLKLLNDDGLRDLYEKMESKRVAELTATTFNINLNPNQIEKIQAEVKEIEANYKAKSEQMEKTYNDMMGEINEQLGLATTLLSTKPAKKESKRRARFSK